MIRHISCNDPDGSGTAERERSGARLREISDVTPPHAGTGITTPSRGRSYTRRCSRLTDGFFGVFGRFFVPADEPRIDALLRQQLRKGAFLAAGLASRWGPPRRFEGSTKAWEKSAPGAHAHCRATGSRPHTWLRA
jgi:hypothetical protein